VWSLTEDAEGEPMRTEAIRAAVDCPAGRLEMRDKKTGEVIEPPLEPGISILQDPELGVSGPLYVTGGVPLIGADGEPYELRNRYTLCRCGESRRKPFCDAAHVNAEYTD
jgi:hypothetical protein